MKKMMYFLSEKFAPRANAFFSKPWLSGLSSGMQKIIPFVLVGSLISLYNILVSFMPFLPDLGPIHQYSFGLISLIVAFLVTSQCMEKLNHPFYVVNAGITSVCVAIMALSPIGEKSDSISALLTNLGPTGIAVSMIVGIVVAIIFHNWGKLRFLKDSSIPDFVTGWINTLVPAFISLGLAMILIFKLNINILSTIQAGFRPLFHFGQTLPGAIVMFVIPVIFYTMGVSSWMFTSLWIPILMTGTQANIDAVAQGLPPTAVFSTETVFTLGFLGMGGMCCTLALNLLMVFSKSKQMRTLGRVFLLPSIFNINEPVMFGAPVVFNPLLMVPAWLTTVVGPAYVWIIMKTGLLNIPTKMINIGQLPAPIGSVLVTEDLRALLWWIVLLAIYLLIWYPFFKVYEKQKLEEEKN